MKVEYSDHLVSSKNLVTSIVNDLAKEYEYISILATDVLGKQYKRDFNTTTIKDSMINERGYVARVHNGHGYCEYSFNQLNETNLEEVKNDIRKVAKTNADILMDAGIQYYDYSIISEEPIRTKYIADTPLGYIDAKAEEIVAKLGEVIRDVKEYSTSIVNTIVGYEQVVVSKGFYSNERQLEQAYTYSVANMVCFATGDDDLRYSITSYSGQNGFECFDQIADSYQASVNKTIELLKAETIKADEYDVICNPIVSGLIAHEAFGHGVEMDMFIKNRAKGQEYIDEYVASKKTNMHDGAQSAVDVATYLFDDEGVFGTDTKIIDEGILIAGISDLLSALRLGTSPTGNGRRESYERKTYARMTNTFFAAGKDNLDDMIGSIKYGFMLEDYNSGMEDPKNWGIQCIVSSAREIVDGEYTGKIFGPIMLTGYVPDILKAITMVSDTDVHLCGGGYCGKGYKEWAKTSIGGVYMKTRARLG